MHKLFLIAFSILLLSACSPQPAVTPADSTTPPVATVASPTETSLPIASDTSSPTDTLMPSPGLSGEVEIEIEDFAFRPAEITITTGTTVKFGNKDDVGHSVKADDGTWSSALLAKGEEFFFTFTTPGTYTYHCEPHTSMTGTIIVVAP
jgi:plastocyanin